MLIIAVIATLFALVQNAIVFAFGLKELAIFAFPLSFTGIFLAELAAIWAGYFAVPRLARRRPKLLLAGWATVILAVAEATLPASYFTMWVRHERRARVLSGIALTGSAIEPLASDRGGARFALTYTLTFPKTGHYLTFPAYIGPPDNRVYGDYFTKLRPEYYEEDHIFEGGRPYDFTVVFDTGGRRFDFAKEPANIDICDGKDYFMVCRVVAVGLDRVPAALAALPAPTRREPAVPADTPRDIAEKGIRLAALRLQSPMYQAGQPIEFSFSITNVGERDVAIPGEALGNVIAVSYGWEPVSDSAKATAVPAGIVHFAGNVVAAGGAQFALIRRSSLRPGEILPVQDKLSPFEPFAPGVYRLHAYLFSRYATEPQRPVQELVADFSVVP